MQTPFKKRKIQGSPEVYEDDDWENDFTAEEFDFLQSQVADEVLNVPTKPDTQVAQQNQPLNSEVKLVLEGEISMLRLSLKQKSEELEKLRQEQGHLASSHLKELQETERNHLINIDHLKSALKFKEHELSSEQAKVKSLQNKLKTSSVETANSVARPSPLKVASVTSHSSFLNIPHKLHCATQTEPGGVGKDKSNRLLILDPVYSNVKGYMKNVHEPNSEVQNENSPCKFILKTQGHKCVFLGLGDKPCSFQISSKFERFPLAISCCCSKRTEIPNPNSSKEMQMLQIFETRLKEYNQNLKNFLTSSESPKSPAFALLTDQICKLLADLCNFLTMSLSACTSLVRTCKEKEDAGVLCEDLITLIFLFATPIFNNHQLMNANVIAWCLKVLITICEACNYCCCTIFANVKQDIKLCRIIDSRRSVETAYLALMFLEHCVRIRKLFIHEEGECVISSMSELLKHCFHACISRSQQTKCVFACCHLLRSVIFVHGSTAIYSKKCICIVKVLNEIFKWICEQNVYDDHLCLEVFNLVQILYKFLDCDSWFQLRSRMNDSYVSTLNKVGHIQDFDMTPVKEIVLELWEQENYSPKLRCETIKPKSSGK